MCYHALQTTLTFIILQDDRKQPAAAAAAHTTDETNVDRPAKKQRMSYVEAMNAVKPLGELLLSHSHRDLIQQGIARRPTARMGPTENGRRSWGKSRISLVFYREPSQQCR